MDDETHTDKYFDSNRSSGSATGNEATFAIFSRSHHFTVSGGTFTNVTKNYHAPAVPLDFRKIPLGDIDLQCEISLNDHSGVIHRLHERQSLRRVYSANIEGRTSSVTVAVYEGDGAEEEWRRDVAKYMTVRHPNIVQIFGTARSGNIHATILHDELIPLEHFLAQHQDSHFSTVYIYAYVATAFEAAADYIDSTFQHWLYDSGCTLFIRRSTRRFCADLVPSDNSRVIKYTIPPNAMVSQQGLELLGTANMHTSVIETLSLKQYHEICYWHFAKFHNISTSAATIVNLGAVISCSSGNQPRDLVEVASLPHVDLNRRTRRWQAYGWEGNLMDNGWTRFDLGAGDDTFIWLELRSLDGIHWLGQANDLFRRLRISSNLEDFVVLNYISFEVNIFGRTADSPQGFLFLAPPSQFQPRPLSFQWPKCAAYWALEPTGAQRLSTRDAENLGFPSLGLSTAIVGRSWNAAIYAGLREFHRAKGFDPDSQDVARHLGYLLYQVSEDAFLPGEVESHSEDRDSKTASTDARSAYVEEATVSDEDGERTSTGSTPSIVVQGDILCPEADYDSSHVVNFSVHDELFPASEKAILLRRSRDLPAVSGILNSLIYIQLALISFLAVSWLYDRI